MAVYKLFPDKDTFIFTEVPIANAGYDEMIELGGYHVQEIGQASRILLHFNSNEVANVILNKAGSTDIKAEINLKLASAYETPTSHSVYAYPVYEYWDGGIGKYGDYPWDKSGVSWRYSRREEQDSWVLPHNTVTMPDYVTGSYSERYPGGGNWYTGSADGTNLESVVNYETNDDLDLKIDVTQGVLKHFNGDIDNNGFIIKFEDEIEFNVSSSIRHKFYSTNTNTIYPPSLDLKWDDSIYETGSLAVLNDSEVVVEITNNKGKYPDIGKQRFRLLARPRFPQRTFSTTSIYKQNNALPVNTVWGLQDEFTEEMVIPFDENYTKVSCDENGPYFDIYMEGLQPERFYRLLIKSEIDGTTVVVTDRNTFKVVRNG